MGFACDRSALGVRIRRLHIDDHEVVALEVPDESRRRVDHKAGTADDEGISAADCRDCARQYLLIQLLVEDDVRPMSIAVLGARHTCARVKASTSERAAPRRRRVRRREPVHRLGACRLMEAVDVLGDDAACPPARASPDADAPRWALLP